MSGNWLSKAVTCMLAAVIFAIAVPCHAGGWTIVGGHHLLLRDHAIIDVGEVNKKQKRVRREFGFDEEVEWLEFTGLTNKACASKSLSVPITAFTLGGAAGLLVSDKTGNLKIALLTTDVVLSINVVLLEPLFKCPAR